MITNVADLVMDLRKENARLRGELSELRCNLNSKVEQERKRIDVLCRDIECKFNRYFTELKAQYSTIVSDVPTLKVNRYEENAPIYPAIAEFGEIEVEPLRLRFVRGYKEYLWKKKRDMKYTYMMIFVLICMTMVY